MINSTSPFPNLPISAGNNMLVRCLGPVLSPTVCWTPQVLCSYSCGFDHSSYSQYLTPVRSRYWPADCLFCWRKPDTASLDRFYVKLKENSFILGVKKQPRTGVQVEVVWIDLEMCVKKPLLCARVEKVRCPVCVCSVVCLDLVDMKNAHCM